MTDGALSFFVQGHPAPGGSKNAIPVWRKDGSLVLKKTATGRQMPIINMVDSGGEGNAIWKKAVKERARFYMLDSKPLDGPVKCELVFFMQRPLKHFVNNDRSRPLREDAPQYHTQMPDALKLARSTEDALTSVIWLDDSQNVRICSEKRWCNPGEKSGCAVKVIPISIQQQTPQPNLL